MKKTIQTTTEKEVYICNECGLEIDYSIEGPKALTEGGVGIDTAKLGAVSIEDTDQDFHMACLKIVISRDKVVPATIEIRTQKSEVAVDQGVELKEK